MEMTHCGTKPIETERLVLRRFTMDDASGMFEGWASDPQVTRHLSWEPHPSVDETRRVLENWVASYSAPDNYLWIITERDTGRAMGSIDLHGVNSAAMSCEAGYCMGSAFWNRGYMTEALRAVLHFAFIEAGFHRVMARHRSENPASGRVMAKAGMRFEGVLRGSLRRKDGGFSDCCVYGLLKGDRFPDAVDFAFFATGVLADGELELVPVAQNPAQPERGWVAQYLFEMRVRGQRAGECALRVGFSESVYYGGHIAYGVEPALRGRGYAGRACRLLAGLARRHGYDRLIITNEHTNLASRRVCQKLGARMVRRAPLPEYNDMYREGQRVVCIWEWEI